MSVSDPNNRFNGALANFKSDQLITNDTSSGELQKYEKNEFSVRVVAPDDLAMLESIEREAFPGINPVTRLERDLARQNGLYLAATRRWYGEEQELGPRYAIATKSEKEDVSFAARVKRNVDRYVLDRIARPNLPSDYIAGFIGMWLVLDEAHVVIIGLRESDRRKGIGELLLISAIEHAVENDCRMVTLEVRESNKPAIELYRKYGFQKVGLRRRYYSDTRENAVIMTTPPIQNDDYRNQFTTLVEQHADKWGRVSSPGFDHSDSSELDEPVSEDSAELEVED